MFTTNTRKIKIATKSETIVITVPMFGTVIKRTWTMTGSEMPVTLTRTEMVG